MNGEMSDEALRRAVGFSAEDAAHIDRLTAALDRTPCAARTVAHRRWSRFWGAFAVTTLTVGVVADTTAQIGWGYPATLTCTIRRALGIHPRTRYATAGQVALGTALGWALIHLVWGVLGPTRGRELA